MLGLLLIGAAAAIQTSGIGSSQIFLVERVMALQAERANSQLGEIAEELNRMLQDQRQARRMQSLYEDIVREQDRLIGASLEGNRRRAWSGAAITSDQRAWASTLPQLCPPGSERRDCLAKALIDRLDVLKAMPTP